MAYPFLDQRFPVPWSQLTVDRVRPDISYAIDQTMLEIQSIASPPATELSFDSVFVALQRAGLLLRRGSRRGGHLNSTMGTPALRAAFNEMLPLVTELQTSVYLDDGLWQVVKRTSELLANAPLSPIDRRLVDETVLDFKSHGAGLPPEGKARLDGVDRELSRASECYKERVLCGTKAFDIFITNEAALSGIPPAVLAAAKEAAGPRERPDAWRFTLDWPSYIAVL
jgi:oligopeptidase A